MNLEVLTESLDPAGNTAGLMTAGLEKLRRWPNCRPTVNQHWLPGADPEGGAGGARPPLFAPNSS